MADHLPLASLSLGHTGALTYIPQRNPQDGPGHLHTTRLIASCPNFHTVSPAVEIYPPSKSHLPEASSCLWRERRLQQRWLLNSHPEATMGNFASYEFLKDDMQHFARKDEAFNDDVVLAVGQMADVIQSQNSQVVPVLAVATGESGEYLRLVRMTEPQFQWEGHDDASLGLSVIDTTIREDEVLWMGDGLPITGLRFATNLSQSNTVRWLMVQKQTSTTILRPEYHPVPIPGSGHSGLFMHQRPSFIKPNPLVTLHHDQTGGNAHSDMALNPAMIGRPPQLAVIDECGYWSVWNILGTWQIARKTLRLDLYKCGHISEGLLSKLPSQSSYPAEKHGLLRLWKSEPSEIDQTKEESEDADSIPALSQLFLIWNSKRFDVFDLDTNLALPRLDGFWLSRGGRDEILDIQRSPVNDKHIIILTTRQVLWIDLFPQGVSLGPSTKPVVLLAVPHISRSSELLKMAICPTSIGNANSSLVFVYASTSDTMSIYRLSLAPGTNLADVGRCFAAVPKHKSNKANIQLFQVQPVQLRENRKSSNVGPGTEYRQRGVQFYQVNLLGEDLGLRNFVCAMASDSPADITAPTSRVGWTKTHQTREWKVMRKRFLAHLGDTFVVPDEMTEADMDSLLTRHESVQLSKDIRQAPPSLKAVGKHINLDVLCSSIRESFRAAYHRGQVGLPSGLFDAIREVISDGIVDGKHPLMTWSDVASNNLATPLEYEDARNGMEEEVEALFREADGKTIITQLRISSAKESPNSRVSLPYLQRKYADFWLDDFDGCSEEVVRLKKTWISEIATDVLLASYGVAVQGVPLFGSSGNAAVQESQRGGSRSQVAQATPSKSPSIRSSPTPRAPDASDSTIQRLKVLAPSLRTGELGMRKSAKVLSYWPVERGVETEGYVSSVAVAHDELFREARERLQKIEAKRKKAADKYKRPAFMRQGFPASDGPGTDIPSSPVVRSTGGKRPSAQIMSSQAAPSSSQTQVPSAPMVTMSQPVPGAFGGDRKKKKSKRKSGFR